MTMRRKPGDTVVHKGRNYRFVRAFSRTYSDADATPDTVELEGRCAMCGRPYRATVPFARFARWNYFVPKTCDLHRGHYSAASSRPETVRGARIAQLQADLRMRTAELRRSERKLEIANGKVSRLEEVNDQLRREIAKLGGGALAANELLGWLSPL